MGRGMEIVTGFATAPSATITALTMGSGDSLTVRNAPFDKNVWLLNLWAANQVAGILQVRSPKLHDNVQGIRNRITVADTTPLFPFGFKQKLVPQDTLIAGLSGSAVGGQIEQASMLIYYEELPGANARLVGWDDIKDKIVNMLTVEVSCAAGAAGGYSGQSAINSSFDLMQANTDYALIGYNVNAQCCSVGFRGADTGNLRVGGPGKQNARWLTEEWFKRMGAATGLPMIPVFNSANRAGILVDVAQDQAAAAVLVTATFAQLAPNAISK